jgi:hypothetical protein
MNGGTGKIMAMTMVLFVVFKNRLARWVVREKGVEIVRLNRMLTMLHTKPPRGA